MPDKRDEFTPDALPDPMDQIQPIESVGGEASVSPIEEVAVEFRDLSLRYNFYPTSLGNAERFIVRHAMRLRYVVEMAVWLFWCGFWEIDLGEVHARQLAKDTVKSRYDELQTLDDQRRKYLFGWLQKSESDDKITEILRLASTDPNIAISVRQLDAHPDLLLCGNGVIDLRTGALSENLPELYLTRRTPVLYDPDAKSQEWDDFLDQASAGDNELRRFLQTAVGYSSTGFTREEVMFLVHGPGGRGKSTFIDAIARAIGSYHATANFTTFLMRDRASSGPSEDIARLAGARLVTSIEVEEGQKLAEALVKQLTGGDEIAARYLYKGTFEYKPQFALWLVCNHLPTVSNHDEAMWRRILRLPFVHKPAVVNKGLKAILTDRERTGPSILAWVVRGAIDWFEHGLRVPDSVRLATEQAREQMDPLADFVEEEYTFDSKAFTPAVRVRLRYEIWCRANGQSHPLGRRNFDRQMEARGLTRQHKYVDRTKTWCWVGIREGATVDAPGTMPERFTEPKEGSKHE